MTAIHVVHPHIVRSYLMLFPSICLGFPFLLLGAFVHMRLNSRTYVNIKKKQVKVKVKQCLHTR